MGFLWVLRLERQHVWWFVSIVPVIQRSHNTAAKKSRSLCRLLHWTKQGRCNTTAVCDFGQQACIPQSKEAMMHNTAAPVSTEWDFTNTLSSQTSFETMEWHNNIIIYCPSYMTVDLICSEGGPRPCVVSPVCWHFQLLFFFSEVAAWRCELLFKSPGCGSHAWHVKTPLSCPAALPVPTLPPNNPEKDR